jgi:putative ABC transport system ATP-binding protein
VTGRLVEDILFSLNSDHEITLVIVTHDEELAARCDRQMFVRDGRDVHATEMEEGAACMA